MDRLTGVVSEWKEFFGFINVDNSKSQDDELFFHFSAINKDGFKKLAKGDRVSFTIGNNHKGLIAEDIDLLEQDY